MCGIVAYFGGAGNNLTRVMTGMSAIIYRAPDSTGVAIFGDDSEPVRTRRAVGSVEQLVEDLLDNGIYRNDNNQLMSVWTDGLTSDKLLALQQRLIVFEGFSIESVETAVAGDSSYPTIDDLVDLNTDTPARLLPGQPGRPFSKNVQAVRSRRSLSRLILLLIKDYDLAPVVVREIIRKPLIDVIDGKLAQGAIQSDKTAILNCFDRVFESILSGKKAAKPQPDHRKQVPASPQATKALWLCLQETLVEIPAGYNRDGVGCLFRLLDAALLTKLTHRPELLETLEQILMIDWPLHRRPGPVNWKALYLAEKGVNLYGRAAAAAFTCLQRDNFLTEMLSNGLSGSDIMDAAAIIPGQTDPVGLRYFTQPIIAHGRWALQSAVTVKNAHPFVDAKRQRSIVINGQFDGQTEDNIKRFLAKVGGLSFRSENSAEYHCLLWGYYYQQLEEARNRYTAVLAQVENEMQALAIGSHSIDYAFYQAVKDKTGAELDRTAFIRAARQIAKNGGQVAACGMSVLSPRRLYVAVHNRPAFVVRRLENDDFMVVSDINAAMGLFPQQLILDKLAELDAAQTDYKKVIARLGNSAADRQKMKALKTRFKTEREIILKSFSVEVHALDGEEIFVCIETGIADGSVTRRMEITDFAGEPLPEIEPFQTFLSPEQVKKDHNRSFYETHLEEIPERLLDILKQYAPEEDQLPDFAIRKSQLRRRFGAHLDGLKRIVIAGTGSSYYMGTIAKSFCQAVLPEMDVLTVRPGDLDNPEVLLAPEKDLVILLSWSSTTADMVMLAKKLTSLKVIMIGVTEKTYADMALIAAKSGGLIPTLSQEEVTVSGVKSTVCVLFCLKLFCLWLAARMGRDAAALDYLQRMQRIPHILALTLEDETLGQFIDDMTGRYADSAANIVISAMHTDQAGGEVALKLEENTWAAVGKTLDYQDVLDAGLPAVAAWAFVLVDATCLGRLPDALAVMDYLKREKIEFVSIGIASQEQAAIENLSSGCCTFLPDMHPNVLQPIVNLVFYYQLAYYFSKARGIATGIAPRNRAKSMTVGRNLFYRKTSPAREIAGYKDINAHLSAALSPAVDPAKPSLWEQNVATATAQLYYRGMRQLMGLIFKEKAAPELFLDVERNLAQLARNLFDDNSDTDEIIFMPADSWAAAAMQSAANTWGRLLGYPVRMVSPVESVAAFGNSTLLLAAATSPSSRDRLLQHLATATCPICLLAPAADYKRAPATTRGGVFLVPHTFTRARSDALYAALNLIFIQALQLAAPAKAAVVQEHFLTAMGTLGAILNNPDLKQGIAASVALNKRYQSLFYIGPPTGAGRTWVNKLDRIGHLLAEQHQFGESAHGPLVTIDPRVAEKFVKMDAREKLTARFGADLIAAWEHRYLANRDVDSFLKSPPTELARSAATAFYAGEVWCLPELNPDYAVADDNLIVLDATSNRYFLQALDEIATLGCRYPRMVLITQAAFLESKNCEQLYKFPVSSTIALPATGGGSIPDMHLPFVLNIIGEEFSACVENGIR